MIIVIIYFFLFAFSSLSACELSEPVFKKQKTENSLVALMSAQDDLFKLEKSVVGVSEMLAGAFGSSMKEQEWGVFKFINYDSQEVSNIKTFLEHCHNRDFDQLVAFAQNQDEISKVQFKIILDYLMLNQAVIKWIEKKSKEVVANGHYDISSFQSFIDILPGNSKSKILQDLVGLYSGTLNRMLLKGGRLNQQLCEQVIFDKKISPGILEILHQVRLAHKEYLRSVPDKSTITVSNEGIKENLNSVLDDNTITLSKKRIVLCKTEENGVKKRFLDFPEDCEECYKFFNYYFYVFAGTGLVGIHSFYDKNGCIFLWDLSLNDKERTLPKATFVSEGFCRTCYTLVNNLLFVGYKTGEINIFDLTQTGDMIPPLITIPMGHEVMHLKVEGDFLYVQLQVVTKADNSELKEFHQITKKIDMGPYFSALRVFKENLSIKDIVLLKTLSS